MICTIRDALPATLTTCAEASDAATWSDPYADRRSPWPSRTRLAAGAVKGLARPVGPSITGYRGCGSPCALLVDMSSSTDGRPPPRSLVSSPRCAAPCPALRASYRSSDLGEPQACVRTLDPRHDCAGEFPDAPGDSAVGLDVPANFAIVAVHMLQWMYQVNGGIMQWRARKLTRRCQSWIFGPPQAPAVVSRNMRSDAVCNRAGMW